MGKQHHILLFGATGSCGQIFVRAALEAGHRLTLYVRTPSKLGTDLSENANITIIQGELGDLSGLQRAASCGADVFISLAGPTIGRREGTPITTALQNFYPLLLKANSRIHIMVLSTASYAVPEDSRSIKWFFAINGYVRIIGGDSYIEINGISKETAKLGDDVDWTLFRVPLLTGNKLSEDQIGAIRRAASDDEANVSMNSVDASRNDVNAKVHAAYVGDKKGRDWVYLHRGRLAVWILGELEERRWIRSCPTLANASL